jgi:hypothetical protein
MWIPVIFFCLVDGSCSFWTKEIYDDRRECEIVTLALLNKMDADPVISAAEGVCLPIKLKHI